MPKTECFELTKLSSDLKGGRAEHSVNESFSEKVLREIALTGAGLCGIKNGAIDSFAKPSELIENAALSVGMGFGIGRFAPSSGILGFSAKLVGGAMGLAFARDLALNGRELASVMADNWHSDRNWKNNVAVMENRLGRFAFDSLLMTAGGLAGAHLSTKILPAETLLKAVGRASELFQSTQLQPGFAGIGALETRVSGKMDLPSVMEMRSRNPSLRPEGGYPRTPFVQARELPLPRTELPKPAEKVQLEKAISLYPELSVLSKGVHTIGEGKAFLAEEGAVVTALDGARGIAAKGSLVQCMNGSEVHFLAGSKGSTHAGSKAFALDGSELEVLDGSRVVVGRGSKITVAPGARLFPDLYTEGSSSCNIIVLKGAELIWSTNGKIEAQAGSIVRVDGFRSGPFETHCPSVTALPGSIVIATGECWLTAHKGSYVEAHGNCRNPIDGSPFVHPDH
ncbi:MAG: hypothetical protein K2X27_02240 [Candidatus Obscuribacterales bacterium]|nr:hypothetical protein [Candidatus Obscuribacterales bacterium]